MLVNECRKRKSALRPRGAASPREVERRPDYSFWNVGVTATVGRAEFDLSDYNTDLTFITCGHSRNCGGGLAAKVSWNAW
jgi:hypothetical protein